MKEFWAEVYADEVRFNTRDIDYSSVVEIIDARCDTIEYMNEEYLLIEDECKENSVKAEILDISSSKSMSFVAKNWEKKGDTIRVKFVRDKR